MDAMSVCSAFAVCWLSLSESASSGLTPIVGSAACAMSFVSSLNLLVVSILCASKSAISFPPPSSAVSCHSGLVIPTRCEFSVVRILVSFGSVAVQIPVRFGKVSVQLLAWSQFCFVVRLFPFCSVVMRCFLKINGELEELRDTTTRVVNQPATSQQQSSSSNYPSIHRAPECKKHRRGGGFSARLLSLPPIAR